MGFFDEMLKRPACVLAHESKYCGPAALATVAANYGLHISPAQLGAILETDLQGTDLVSLRRCAQQLGFSASCGKVKMEQFDKLPLPAIAHYNDTTRGHFVVIHTIDAKRLVVADPAKGLLVLSREDFIRRWSGYVLLLSPSLGFHANKKQSSQYRELLTIAWGQKSAILLATVMAALVNLSAFGLAAFAQLILDRIVPSSDIRLLYSLAFGIVLLAGFRFLSNFTREFLLLRLGERIELTLGLQYTRRILCLPTRFFDRESPGDVLTRVNDVSNVRWAIVGAMLSALLDLVLLTAYTIFLVWYSVVLTAAVLCVVPPVIAIIAAINCRLLIIEREFREQWTELASQFIEMVANIKVIKIFTGENYIYNRIAAKYQQIQASLSRRSTLSGLSGGVCGLLTNFIAIAVLVVGARLTIQGRLTIGQLMFFYSVVGLMLGGVDRLAPTLATIQAATIGMERLKAIECLVPENESSSGGVHLEHREGGIEFQDVSFWYRQDHPVLTHINLKIGAGECVAILGETGSGKSTLACLASGLYLPNEGNILIDGQCIREINKESLHRHIATVFQEPSLMNGTILENIALGDPESCAERIREAARLAQADQFILRLPRGYHYNVGTGGVALSSGERQRVAIARALLRNPAILILDEATGSLDGETERKIMEAVLNARGKRTTIIITHRPSVALRADRAIILHGGTIAEEGTHQDLIAMHGRYYQMMRMRANCGAMPDEQGMLCG